MFEQLEGPGHEGALEGRNLPSRSSRPDRVQDQADCVILPHWARDLHEHPLVQKAAAKAAEDFHGVDRHTSCEQAVQPYFNHLGRTAMQLVIEKAKPEVIAAAYLRKHLEGVPEIASKSSIAAQFGDRVAELVDWVTEQDKSLPWSERKERYQERLKFAPLEAQLISVADQLCKLQDFVAALRSGSRPNEISEGGWKQNSEHFWKLYEIYSPDLPDSILSRFKDRLGDFDRLGQPAECGPPEYGTRRFWDEYDGMDGMIETLSSMIAGGEQAYTQILESAVSSGALEIRLERESGTGKLAIFFKDDAGLEWKEEGESASRLPLSVKNLLETTSEPTLQFPRYSFVVGSKGVIFFSLHQDDENALCLKRQ